MNLFGRPANWFSIASGRPFLNDLAAGLSDALERRLSEAVILLPNRRGVRILAQALVKHTGGRAMLLPQVRALGDLEEDEPPFEPGDIAADLPPAISPLRRRFELARLVHDHMYALGRSLDTTGTFQLADALGAFFESLEIEEIDDRGRIAALAEGDFAGHWRQSADFLALAAEAWPRRLQELGLVDPASRRIALLNRLAAQWDARAPLHPVIAAGSTGSVKASAALMAAIARAPQGCVVLPGFDASLDEKAWADIEPHHPQFALSRLLIHAGIGRDDVHAWNPHGEIPGRWRRRLLNEALRPAKMTGDWIGKIENLRKEGKEGEDPVVQGLEGLHLITARAEADAAAIAAVLLREALETPGSTAALVSPDQTFARAVSARLARWGVAVDSSAGSPLADCPVGVLLGLIARYMTEPQDPVALLALLKHPLVRLGVSEADRVREREVLERFALRGPRARDWDRLFKRLTDEDQDVRFAERVRSLLAPAARVFQSGEADAARAARVLAETAEELARDHAGDAGALWAGPAGECASRLLAETIEDGATLPPLDGEAFGRLVEHMLAAESVRLAPLAHPRVQILGALEARLVHADRVILAGLEEGVWPPNAATDPFLSRPMRRALGLPSPERRIGLSAHDFVQLASSPEVYLIHTQRRGGQPTVKSRWLWRLETLASGAGIKTLPARPDVLGWAAALDAAPPPPPPVRPAPRPPVAHRPKALAVTRIETLTRDPYAIWAGQILKLKALRRPDEEADAMIRGVAIHEAFEDFTRLWKDELADDAARHFRGLLLEKLLDHGVPAAALAREDALAVEAAGWIVDWEIGRRQARPAIFAERSGAWGLPYAGGSFELSAKADRIEVTPEGLGHVIDFKSGATPSRPQVTSGFSPQLTLTAAILRAGGFREALPVKGIGDLMYVRVTGRKPAGKVETPVAKDAVEQIDKAVAGLTSLLNAYLDPRTPYISRLAVQFLSSPSDYDHLARVYEWASAGEEGGGE